MGCGQSAPMDDAAKQRSEMIEKELRKAEKETRQDIKILFLGAGGVSLCLANVPR